MRSSRLQAGYNLVMLMVLLTILNIVVAASLPAWSNVIRRDKEEELIFRGLQYAEAVRVFQIRFQRPPVRLEELVEAGYLRKVPMDPITKRNDTWVPVYEEVDPDAPPPESDSNEDGSPGIVDIHSGSPLNSLDGTPYSEW